jgi:hypothetical protein
MRKQLKKMSLSRETLHALATGKLSEVAAGAYTYPPVCENSANARNTCTRFC